MLKYNRREILEINPPPSDIDDNVLEAFVCHMLSLKGITAEHENLQACHRMKRKDRVTIKFKCRKQKHRVLSICKNLQNKSLDLSPIKFSGKLFLKESMCHEKPQLCST